MVRYEIWRWDGVVHASYVQEDLAWEHFHRLSSSTNAYELREVTSKLLAFKGEAK